MQIKTSTGQKLRTVDDVLTSLPGACYWPIPKPEYTGSSSKGVGLAVECMKRHMSDEGWQFFLGLESAGYDLYGYKINGSLTDVNKIIAHGNPGVAVVQDKREWGLGKKTFREDKAEFTNIEALKNPDIFTLTVVRDAHHNPSFHDHAARDMGVNAWVCFYHPRIVKHLAAYVREEHLVRTYNCIDPSTVPEFAPASKRSGTLLSGAVSGAYPFRRRIRTWGRKLPGIEVLNHPGYHADGTCTPRFLKLLNQFKVAVCTSSIYGYALRKLIEATACGCIVLTDLPVDEVMPEIDGNLIRISDNQTYNSMRNILLQCYEDYDEERQRSFAQKAKDFYSYRSVGARLVQDIERLRCEY